MHTHFTYINNPSVIAGEVKGAFHSEKHFRFLLGEESRPNATKRETFQGESLETDSYLISPNSISKFQESSELAKLLRSDSDSSLKMFLKRI
jgi:hypothetical protein